MNQDFVITDLTLAEFYSILYRQNEESAAVEWNHKLHAYCRAVSRQILITALKYRIDHKKENLSIFDCVGYIFALENNLNFVTGDRAFKNKEGVMFISK